MFACKIWVWRMNFVRSARPKANIIGIKNFKEKKNGFNFNKGKIITKVVKKLQIIAILLNLQHKCLS